MTRGLSTVTWTGTEVAAFPALSAATAVSSWDPLAAEVVFQETDHPLDPSVSVPMAVDPSRRNVTEETPDASEAFACTVIVPVTVAPDAGEEIATVGGVLSTVTFTAALVVVWFAVSVAIAVRLWFPSPA